MYKLSIALSAFKMPLGKAAVIAVLGLLIVFAVLAVLVGLLTLFKVIFGAIETHEKKESKPAPAAVQAATDDDPDELTAVITAAIACMEEEAPASAPFRVKSIRRVK